MLLDLHFFQSPHVIAFFFALLIFLLTLLLVVKRWIGFSITLLLLLFSLLVGLIINYHQDIQNHFNSYSATQLAPVNSDSSQDVFQKQILQTVEDLKNEMQTEKENMRQVMSQMQEISNSLDAQKQKLQNFMKETHEHFKTEDSTKPVTVE